MNDLMELMDKLGIPQENIIIRDEPEYSRDLLIGLENQYHINTSNIVANYESLSGSMIISDEDIETWLNAYEVFKRNGGLDSQINGLQEFDFLLNSDEMQKEEADFISPTSSFLS